MAGGKGAFGLAAALLFGLALATPAANAEDKLDYVASFKNGSLVLDVCTYTQSNGRIGLLGWRSGEARNAFAFRLDEWDKVADLWKKAVRAQGGAWKTVGTVRETGTTDISVLSVKAGPGIELAVASPQVPSIAYVLAPTDFADFEKALEKAKAYVREAPFVPPR
ncbi:MAG TPA: hypothetical protein VEH75_02010 [Xanthobacteraceae bacterium]|nr:hypothetical protein [Xanthobacteraceae bacterium]